MTHADTKAERHGNHGTVIHYDFGLRARPKPHLVAVGARRDGHNNILGGDGPRCPIPDSGLDKRLLPSAHLRPFDRNGLGQVVAIVACSVAFAVVLAGVM